MMSVLTVALLQDYIMPVSDSSGAPWLCLEFVLSISDDRKQSSAQQQQQRQVEQAVQHNRYLEQVIHLNNRT